MCRSTRPCHRGASSRPRAFRCDAEEGCWDLVALLLRDDRSAGSGGPGLDWSALHQTGAGAAERPSLLTWGGLRATVQGWIAPGGPKERDRNRFGCFQEGGYFGRAFGADQVATSRHLEDYCPTPPHPCWPTGRIRIRS